jgi:hypothetical protein
VYYQDLFLIICLKMNYSASKYGTVIVPESGWNNRQQD